MNGSSSRSKSTRKSIFDPEGRWLGDLDTPERLGLTDIGDDYVLGVFTDAMGVEYVHAYSLRKP